jgi:hypothetical protein
MTIKKQINLRRKYDVARSWKESQRRKNFPNALPSQLPQQTLAQRFGQGNLTKKVQDTTANASANPFDKLIAAGGTMIENAAQGYGSGELNPKHYDLINALSDLGHAHQTYKQNKDLFGDLGSRGSAGFNDEFARHHNWLFGNEHDRNRFENLQTHPDYQIHSVNAGLTNTEDLLRSFLKKKKDLKDNDEGLSPETPEATGGLAENFAMHNELRRRGVDLSKLENSDDMQKGKKEAAIAAQMRLYRGRFKHMFPDHKNFHDRIMTTPRVDDAALQAGREAVRGVDRAARRGRAVTTDDIPAAPPNPVELARRQNEARARHLARVAAAQFPEYDNVRRRAEIPPGNLNAIFPPVPREPQGVPVPVAEMQRRRDVAREQDEALNAGREALQGVDRAARRGRAVTTDDWPTNLQDPRELARRQNEVDRQRNEEAARRAAERRRQAARNWGQAGRGALTPDELAAAGRPEVPPVPTMSPQEIEERDRRRQRARNFAPVPRGQLNRNELARAGRPPRPPVPTDVPRAVLPRDILHEPIPPIPETPEAYRARIRRQMLADNAAIRARQAAEPRGNREERNRRFEELNRNLDTYRPQPEAMERAFAQGRHEMADVRSRLRPTRTHAPYENPILRGHTEGVAQGPFTPDEEQMNIRNQIEDAREILHGRRHITPYERRERISEGFLRENLELLARNFGRDISPENQQYARDALYGLPPLTPEQHSNIFRNLTNEQFHKDELTDDEYRRILDEYDRNNKKEMLQRMPLVNPHSKPEKYTDEELQENKNRLNDYLKNQTIHNELRRVGRGHEQEIDNEIQRRADEAEAHRQRIERARNWAPVARGALTPDELGRVGRPPIPPVPTVPPKSPAETAAFLARRERSEFPDTSATRRGALNPDEMAAAGRPDMPPPPPAQPPLPVPPQDLPPVPTVDETKDQRRHDVIEDFLNERAAGNRVSRDFLIEGTAIPEHVSQENLERGQAEMGAARRNLRPSPPTFAPHEAPLTWDFADENQVERRNMLARLAVEQERRNRGEPEPEPINFGLGWGFGGAQADEPEPQPRRLPPLVRRHAGAPSDSDSGFGTFSEVENPPPAPPPPQASLGRRVTNFFSGLVGRPPQTQAQQPRRIRNMPYEIYGDDGAPAILPVQNVPIWPEPEERPEPSSDSEDFY